MGWVCGFRHEDGTGCSLGPVLEDGLCVWHSSHDDKELPGDAAGFLVGYSRGRDLATCGALGSLAAAEVISHVGARPQADLAGMAHRVLGFS